MASRKELLRSADCGVKLWKTELLADGGVAATAYFLESLRTPEKPGFDSLAEADAAWLKEVELSEASPLVAQRLGRG
jgi:hypothetical protein